jgi:hypothetical protein
MTLESTFVIPPASGRKRKVRNICLDQEHDWTGQYHDGWLFLDCTICEAENIQYRVRKKQAKALYHGWDINKLYIYIDRYGNHIDSQGNLEIGYLDYKEYEEFRKDFRIVSSK